MAIRIKCKLEGHEKVWVDFQEDRWPFGDRRAMMEGQSDTESLKVILGYVEEWNIFDVRDKKIAFEPGGGLALLDAMDEVLVNWFIGAWFEARGQREGLSKKVS